MHFSKTYTQLLQTLPPELRDNAIEYRKLKKLIHDIVDELEAMGLTPQLLQQLLSGESASEHVSGKGKGRADAGEAPLPKVVYEFAPSTADRIEPRLHFWLSPSSGGSASGLAEISEAGLPSSPTPSDLSTVSEPQSLDPGPSTSHAESGALLYRLQRGLPVANDNALDDELTFDRTHSIDDTQEGSHQVIVPLVNDTAFYALLSSAISTIAAHLQKVHTEFLSTLTSLSQSISHAARPLSATSSFKPHSISSDAGSIRTPLFLSTMSAKSDLYAWREIFQLYVEAEVFENLSERHRGERTPEDSEERLRAFAERVTGRGLGDRRTLKLKESRAALETFLQLNVLLLDLKKFQIANAEATRKILKKHAKRTALPLPTLSITSPTPTTVSVGPTPNDPMTLIIPANIATLPRILVQAISETLLPIIPHVDDYACLICTSIAFKPIRLFCGHLFCVRCLVKMQKRGKGSCPICRAPSVLQADRSNVDWALLNFMQDWFPEESRDKLRSNEREAADEEMQALGINTEGCIIS
ncbi:hypothetical protein FA95DRAFT_1520893 [Auriscalpium vulgare]|uniref:Uncharacterized protein n=1 Tax=Auriscalpium vulgare TaxID=40419 RepID=A0ACB8RPJ9_9AGAM|nr:hypothetical protein FA95DRAFT_1520893 [Auriscalpium vulgare]